MKAENTIKALRIPLANVVISEFNVRKNLEAGTEDSSLEDLAKSIHRHGVLNPITVRDAVSHHAPWSSGGNWGLEQHGKHGNLDFEQYTLFRFQRRDISRTSNS